MIVGFSFCESWEMKFHINLFETGSIPEEGSSISMILGFPIMAIANESFLLLPPERWHAGVFAYF